MTKPAPGQITHTANCGARKPLSSDRFNANFTADKDFRELLEEVRALLSHADMGRVPFAGIRASNVWARRNSS